MGKKLFKIWKKSTAICGRIQDNQHLTKNSNEKAKIKKERCNVLSAWTKNEDNFEK